ncbi:MAG: archease [Desulfatiglandales bacterium]
MRTPKYYKILDHTADLAIRIFGKDLVGLYENAGNSLVHLMLSGKFPGRGTPLQISLSAQDLPDLMVRWLNEILYLIEGERLVVTDLKVRSVTPRQIEATVNTVPFDPEIHEGLTEIKAVTYHQIEVAEKGNHWEARVIMDV